MLRRRTPQPTFASRLLRWFDANKRDLPWRRTRDPWAIWVSEVMLQQTRVEAVREPYARFLHRFATPAAFAAASDDELLVAWRGLGYYRRARLLREGARQVVREHCGEVPRGSASLAALPGIGAYTLGAVGSIAFGHAEVAVDGNVERVVARHRGVRDAMHRAPARRAVRAVAREWLDEARPGDFNQALMELGAVVCTPSSPRCDACPVAADCFARAHALVAELPARAPVRATVEVEARAVLVSGRAGVLGHRIAAGEPNAGQVELPGPGVLASCDADDLAAALRASFGARLEPGPVLATVRHAITHHRIVLRVHAAAGRTFGSLQWFAIGDDVPWTTPARKAFRQALGGASALRA